MAETLSLRTTGVEAVEDTWRRFVPSARLQRADPNRFGFEWRSAQMQGFSVVEYALTASVRSQIDPVGQIMACRVSSPTTWVGNAERTHDPRLPWLSVDGPTRARWDGTARVRAFVFDRVVAQDAARRMVGDDTLVLRTTAGAPRTRALAAQWERAFRYVSDALMTPELDDAPLLEAELRRHALQATLAAFDSTLHDAYDRARGGDAAPRSVRGAIAYMDAHLAEPITIDDVAAAVGLSTRGLQHAFQRARDQSPSAYLRDTRLAAAHAELVRGATASVSEVCRRWGFPSPSRFARYYREAYGRYPSDVLREG